MKFSEKFKKYIQLLLLSELGLRINDILVTLSINKKVLDQWNLFLKPFIIIEFNLIFLIEPIFIRVFI